MLAAQPLKTYADGVSPIAQAGKTCAARVAPIAHPGPNELAHEAPIAHPGPISVHELFSTSSIFENICRWGIDGSSRENMCR